MVIGDTMFHYKDGQRSKQSDEKQRQENLLEICEDNTDKLALLILIERHYNVSTSDFF